MITTSFWFVRYFRRCQAEQRFAADAGRGEISTMVLPIAALRRLRKPTGAAGPAKVVELTAFSV
jgi:hypothetical protein